MDELVGSSPGGREKEARILKSEDGMFKPQSSLTRLLSGYQRSEVTLAWARNQQR